MNKNLIIGIGGVATAGIIITTVAMLSSSSELRNILGDDKISSSAEDKQKIEQLWLEELQDENKYSFCLGEAKVYNNYFDPVLNNSGKLSHTSKEILLFDKEANKLFVMARQVKYNYSGEVNMKFGIISQKIPVKENGAISENYGKNEMPVRLDYGANVIFTNPDTKKTNWVYSDLNGETEMVSARTGCAGIYKLNNSPGHDLLVGADQINIDKDCSEKDISGTYEGTFEYECAALDYRQMKDWLGIIKTEVELQNTKDIGAFEEEERVIELDDASATQGRQ